MGQQRSKAVCGGDRGLSIDGPGAVGGCPALSGQSHLRTIFLVETERPHARQHVFAVQFRKTEIGKNQIVACGIRLKLAKRPRGSRGGIHDIAQPLEITPHQIQQGAFVAIVGPSGSGKTTLLGLLAGLDTPTRGTVVLDESDLTSLSENDRARLRGEKVGFVFQSFQLIPTLTAQENVQVPLELRGTPGAAERARELIDRVGLTGRGHHFPTQLSGGEQQRVAIARAFANSPKILFADEPTGNLDNATGHRIFELIQSLNSEGGSTVVLVTHDIELASHASRMIRLLDGAVVEDTGAPYALPA